MASEAPRSRVGKPTGMVAFRNGMYNMFMRRNSTYMTMVILAGWAGSTLWTRTFDTIWETHNKGKLWKDVVLTLPPPEE